MIVVDRLRPAHLPQVLAHEREAFGAEAWTEGMYREELSDPWNRHYIGAFDVPADAVPDRPSADQLIGWAGLLVIDRTAQILTIGVIAPARRRGAARALMDDMLREARRRRAIEVLLEVQVDNDPARSLYAGYGFAEIGIRRGYYQQAGADAAVLRLELAD